MRLALSLLPVMLIAAPAQQRIVMHHATGTFEVKMNVEARGDGPEGGLPTSRVGVVKTFSGGLVATSTGTMLAVGTPQPGKPAGYVAVEQVRGTLDGRAGGFLLLHRGTMTKGGDSDLSIVIALDSGTGALEGIAGTCRIEIKHSTHFYDLAYMLPAT